MALTKVLGAIKRGKRGFERELGGRWLVGWSSRAECCLSQALEHLKWKHTARLDLLISYADYFEGLMQCTRVPKVRWPQ